jgi:hypothetical protein
MDNRPIELRIREVGQLFHLLDPLPFRERDLDQNVEDYVVGWARELPRRQTLEIVIHLPRAEAETADAQEIPDAIRNYFSYRADMLTRELRELFRFGRAALAAGLGVLAICIVLAAAAERWLAQFYLGSLLGQGLIILGWVANWRPIEIFVYDWQPLVRRRRLYRRLALAQVRLAPA